MSRLENADRSTTTNSFVLAKDKQAQLDRAQALPSDDLASKKAAPNADEIAIDDDDDDE